MNNLNKTARKRNTPTPDILKNLNVKDTNEKGYNKESIDSVFEKKKLNVKPSRVPSEDDPDIVDEEHRNSRKLKKALGYAGWIMCFPLMLAALAIRDRPDPDEEDELKDDPCLPWHYDVNFKYPSDQDRDDRKRL